MPIPLRVLIAEDSPDDAELLLLLLSGGGYEPVSTRAQTAEELQAAFAEGQWNIVLSDYSMPGFGAMAALAICRVLDLDIPFIVVSGIMGEEQAVEMMRAGASDYLLKGKLTRLVPVVVRELREAGNRRAKRQMEQQVSRLAAIVNSSEDAIVSANMDGCVESWNRGAEQLFGYSAAEAMGQSDFLVPPHLNGQFHEIGRRLRSGEMIPSFETVRLKKGGQAIEVSMSLSPIVVGGQVVARSAIYRDISEQKRAERDLLESKERLSQQSHLLQSILHNMSDGVVVADERGKFILFNPAAKEILNQGEVDASPDEWQERFSLYQSDGVTPYPTEDIPLVKALRGESSDFVEMIVNHGGLLEPRWISVNGRPMRDEANLVQGGIVVFRNISERKQAEKALRASEERYRTLVSTTSAIIWDSPPSGEFDTEQPGWTAFTGQTIDEHRGWGWLNAVHPDDREKSSTAWAGAVANRGVYQVEHRLRRADGAYRDMSVRAVPIIESDGAIREWVGVHTDVTDQKRAEEAVRASEEKYRILADNVPGGVFTATADGACDYHNRWWCEYTGKSVGQLDGVGWVETLVPEHRERLPKLWLECVRTGKDFEYEGQFLGANGDYRWFMVRAIPIKDAARRIVRWFGTCTDIEQRKRAEAERAELLALLTLQIERMPLAYLLSGPDFRYTRWNPAAERMFGFAEDEVLGKNPFEVIVPSQSRALVEGIFARLAAGDMDAHGTSENVTKDGRTIICEGYNTPLFGPDGAFQGVLSLIAPRVRISRTSTADFCTSTRPGCDSSSTNRSAGRERPTTTFGRGKLPTSFGAATSSV
jgi:PAS domain S-box-containing protein